MDGYTCVRECDTLRTTHMCHAKGYDYVRTHSQTLVYLSAFFLEFKLRKCNLHCLIACQSCLYLLFPGVQLLSYLITSI